MNKLQALVMLTVIAALTGCGRLSGHRAHPMDNKPAPSISARTLDGAELSLADLKGRVVLLDFWATWCGPCIDALPHVQALADRCADQPVTIIGINNDGPGSDEAVRQYLKAVGVTFTQIIDQTGRINYAYGVDAIPHSVLIDRSGVIRDVHVGYGPQFESQTAKQIDRLLADG